MHTEKLFDKIRERLGNTEEVRTARVKERMEALNIKLQRQLDSQKMTEEVLNKRCTL